VRLFLTRSREPAAGHEDSDKWLENRGAGLGIRNTGANPGHGKCSDEWRVGSREHEPPRPVSRPWPPRSAPDTPPLRLSVEVWRRMKEYSLLAAGPLGKRPLTRRRMAATLSPRRGKRFKDRDPSSGPRRLMRAPVAVHLPRFLGSDGPHRGPEIGLPLGEGKHSFYAPARVIGFPSPRRETVTSDEWRVDSRSPVSRFPSLAPSQCPRHSPASFIGGSVEKDEGIFFVGGGAAREVTPQSARDGWWERLSRSTFSPGRRKNIFVGRSRANRSRTRRQ